MTTDVVERRETEVMYVAAPDRLAGIRRAWDELESALETMRGRRFFGSFDPRTGEYRACVELRDGDDATALGLEVCTLPGGRYLRARLVGEPPDVYARIGPAFEALVREARPDPARPSIEFYRRRDEIDLLLPV